MNSFSCLRDQPAETLAVQSGYAATVMRDCAESTVQDIIGALDSLYGQAGQVKQTKVAYLVLSDSGPLNYGEFSDHPCPALTKEGICDHYSSRPLACRVFQPWTDWSPIKGCYHYPSNRESSQELTALLNRLTELNQAFVSRLGLQRNLDFDYLGQWAIADRFTEQGVDIDPGGRWSL